jgi:hypothetical protein
VKGRPQVEQTQHGPTTEWGKLWATQCVRRSALRVMGAHNGLTAMPAAVQMRAPRTRDLRCGCGFGDANEAQRPPEGRLRAMAPFVTFRPLSQR